MRDSYYETPWSDFGEAVSDASARISARGWAWTYAHHDPPHLGDAPHLGRGSFRVSDHPRHPVDEDAVDLTYPWRACIRSSDGKSVVGAGILVDQWHVLTCAHVASRAA